jgi:uncharacterized protein
MGVLIDTGVYFAKYNVDDVNHEKSLKLFADILSGEFGQPYLLDYVFDELVTLIQVTKKRNDVMTKLGTKILKAKYHELIKVNYDIFQIAWELFQSQNQAKDQKYLSFTDCTIIGAAKFLSIQNICTLDHKFWNINLEGINIIT